MATRKPARPDVEFPGGNADRTLGGAIREAQYDAMMASYDPAPDPTPAPADPASS